MIQNILFLDTETIPSEQTVPQEYVNRFHLENDTAEEQIDYYKRNASLYAEHCKIVAISFGKVSVKGVLYMKSLVGKDEADLLNKLSEAIETSGATSICAHNGLDFDFAILFRRYLINRIKVPGLLNRTNKKTWDPGQLDTMNIWAGPQWKYKCSLECLAITFGLPSPKAEMSGADVCELYYETIDPPKDKLVFEVEEINFKKIGDYCNMDVITMIDLFIIMMEIKPPAGQHKVYTEIVYL